MDNLVRETGVSWEYRNCKTPKTATFCLGCSMAFGGPIFICHPDKDDCWDQIHDPMREIPEYDPKSA